MRALEGGRYKVAIDGFKRLLKQDAREEWREGLAEAYQGRAEAFAAKGMLAEALDSIDNLEALDLMRDTARLRLHCLIVLGKHTAALAYYRKIAQSVSRKELVKLAEPFAAQLIAGDEALLALISEQLPQSLLVQHYEPANQALIAFCAGQDARCAEQLKAISFRSPYRDLRTILSAQLIAAEDPGSAAEQLTRVDSCSPFALVAEVVGAATFEPEAWLTKVATFDHAVRHYAAEIKGVDEKRLNLLLQLQSDGFSAKALFNQLIGPAGQLLEQGRLKACCFNLLTLHPAGIKQYFNKFGDDLTQFEYWRITAIGAEQKGEWGEALDNWMAIFEYFFENEEDGTPTDRLRGALIARHIVNLDRIHFRPSPVRAAKLLTQSLKLDRDDKPAWLQLLDNLKALGDKKACRTMVDQAVKQFPDDGEILMAAVESALASNSFKKAAGLAKRLLKMDPINSRLRSMLINAHLAHARKQIVKRQFQLADKEISLAQQMEREGYATGVIELFRGLLAYATGELVPGEVWIDQACKLGGYRIIYFRTVVEMSRLEMKSKMITPYYKLLKQCATDRPDKKGILTLTRLIEAQLDELDSDLLTKPLAQVQRYLKQGADIEFSEPDALWLCELFERLRAFPLLHAYARQARKRWDRPLLLYYELYGRCSGNIRKLSEAALDDLEDASFLAAEQNDHKTRRLIALFFEQFHLTDTVGQLFIPQEVAEPVATPDRVKPAETNVNELVEQLDLFNQDLESDE